MLKVIPAMVWAAVCLFSTQCIAQTTTPLKSCAAKLVPSGKSVKFDYTYSQNRTYHSPKPWMVRNTKHIGSIWVDAQSFTMTDTISYRGKDYVTKEQLSTNALLYVPAGKKEPVHITKSQFAEEVFEIAKFHPAMLLQYFVGQKKQGFKDLKEQFEYIQYINGIKVSLYINKLSNLLDKVVVTKNEDVYGDVTYTTTYIKYAPYNNNQNFYALETQYQRLQPEITDTLHFSFVEMVDTTPVFIEQPEGYTIKEDNPAAEYVLNREKISENLYALHLPQAESAALLVEFKNFFVVIDVPMNSRNGALVLQEAGKIAPNKPVKYYAFCHHHPWYVGGIRPFIHIRATVLSQSSNREYLQFIADNPHGIEPDSLHIDQKPLLIEEVGKTRTITDGEYNMVMYHIGEKSKHTEDYTLFYFPNEKIVFQGDMVFIKNDKALNKAGGKQIALYDAIQELGIDVETIVQAWPWKNNYNMKTIIPFTELEETVELSKADTNQE